MRRKGFPMCPYYVIKVYLLLFGAAPSIVSTRSFRRMGRSMGQGVKNLQRPAHHLMEAPLLTRWWGIYEQDEEEQLNLRLRELKG